MALLNARSAGLLALLATGVPAGAHVVAIPPSQCRLDPIVLRAGNLEARAAGNLGDDLKLVYDANASVVRLCSADGGAACGPSAARAFTLGDASGSLALPERAGGVMESSGDLRLVDAPVAVTIGDGGATVPVTFTTGLAAVDGTVVEGAPLRGFAGFTLVGVLDGAALPAPLTGRSVALSLSCEPKPIPDTDQFVAPSRLAGLRGEIAGGTARLRATIVRGAADTARFAEGPALLAVRIDDQRVATVIVGQGLPGKRKLIATSDDGRATVTVSKRSGSHFGLLVELRDLDATPTPTPSRAIVGMTFEAGGLLARGERLFRAGPTPGSLRRR